METKRQRLRQRIAQRPHAVRFEELRGLLEAYGWELSSVRGSHYVFRRAAGGQPRRLVIPRRHPTVLPVYVRQVLAALEAVEEEGENNGPHDDG